MCGGRRVDDGLLTKLVRVAAAEDVGDGEVCSATAMAIVPLDV